MRAAWLALGVGAMAVGLVGTVVPLLPTTPFLLLSLVGFSRSSPRLAAWLVDHPRLGPPIRDWKRDGAISRRAKVVAVATMAASPFLSIAMGAPTSAVAAQCLVLAGAAIFVVTRPDACRSSGPSSRRA